MAGLFCAVFGRGLLYSQTAHICSNQISRLSDGMIDQPVSDGAGAPHTANDTQRIHCAERLTSLDAADMMDTPQEEVFDRAVRLATKLTGRPVSLLSFVDGTRQFFKAETGLDGWAAQQRGTPLSHSFCQHVVETDAPLIIADARNDERLSCNSGIDELGIVAYLGVPVHAPDGHPLGSFCVIDGQAHAWDDDDLNVLKDLAAMIETELELRATVRQNDILLDEMNHRIKNLFTLLGGMVRQTARDADDTQQMSDAITGRLQALSAAHALILPKAGDQAQPDNDVSLETLARTVLAPYPDAQIKVDGASVTLGPKAAVAFALSLHELATNAAKYGAFTATAGRVIVTWDVSDDTLGLTWREALPDDVHLEMKNSGFGSRLLQMNVEAQLGGTLQRELTPNGVHVGFDVPMGSLLH